jgi:hypothetical protein
MNVVTSSFAVIEFGSLLAATFIKLVAVCSTPKSGPHRTYAHPAFCDAKNTVADFPAPGTVKMVTGLPHL